jgi:hypothetical protein
MLKVNARLGISICSSIHPSVIKVKGEAIPLQAWTGPEGFRRLRLPDFKTGGTLPPGNIPGTHFC